MAAANYETRSAPTLAQGEAMVTKAIDDFIAYMCADETVKVTDMLIMAIPSAQAELRLAKPKDESKQMSSEEAGLEKLLQQLYTEMLVERIMEKGLDYLLRR